MSKVVTPTFDGPAATNLKSVLAERAASLSSASPPAPRVSSPMFSVEALGERGIQRIDAVNASKPSTPTFPIDPTLLLVTDDDVLEMNPELTLDVARRAAAMASAVKKTAAAKELAAFGEIWTAADRAMTIGLAPTASVARSYAAAAWTLTTRFDGAKAKAIQCRAIELDKAADRLEERLQSQQGE